MRQRRVRAPRARWARRQRAAAWNSAGNVARAPKIFDATISVSEHDHTDALLHAKGHNIDFVAWSDLDVELEDGTVFDVAYNNREVRIDWNLVTSAEYRALANNQLGLDAIAAIRWSAKPSCQANTTSSGASRLRRSVSSASSRSGIEPSFL